MRQGWSPSWTAHVDQWPIGPARCILTSEPPSVLQGPLWPMVPEAILQKWLGRGSMGGETEGFWALWTLGNSGGTTSQRRVAHSQLQPLALRCIKIADEAPTDLKSNLRRAYAKFSQAWSFRPSVAGTSFQRYPGEPIWVWVNTYRYIFSGMNINLPAILGFTRDQGFDPSPYEDMVSGYVFPKLWNHQKPRKHLVFRCSNCWDPRS